jgi:hypothetical protein
VRGAAVRPHVVQPWVKAQDVMDMVLSDLRMGRNRITAYRGSATRWRGLAGTAAAVALPGGHRRLDAMAADMDHAAVHSLRRRP